MVYLIGGPARCGKSTLSKQLAIRTGNEVVHGDFIRPALETVATNEDIESLQLRPKESDFEPAEWIEQLRKRDAVIWKGLKGIIQNVDQHGESIIVEGNIWPDFAAELVGTYALRAAFIIDTSIDAHTERLVKLAKADDTDNNWMNGWGSDRLTKWAGYNVARSLEIARLADSHDFPVFDIADNGISAAQEAALDYL